MSTRTFIRTYRQLIPALCFCVLLLLIRVFFTGTISFLFLSWNLFLAFLPFVFSYRLRMDRPTGLNLIKLILCILFLPNAPYILTDLFHLTSSITQMLWLDTLIITAFAWCGMLFFFYSLRNIQSFMQAIFSERTVQIVLLFLCLLSGFGIYIGRFLRFNSWDVLSNPLNLIYEISQLIFHPLSHPRAWGVTLLYGAFLYLVYAQFKPKNPKRIVGEESYS